MKRKFTLFRLHFTAPLHLGNEREDYTQSLGMIHSDSLYAALTAALFKVGWKPPEDFAGNLGFAISSLFPFYQKNASEAVVYFFPKARKQEMLDESLLERHKQIKKIQWLERSLFEKHIKGEPLTDFYKANRPGTDQPEYIKGAYLCTQKIPENFISKQVFPRVKVSRDGQKDAEPFYMERLFFADNSGMFFLAEGDTTWLEKGLEILKNEGIGTDRNVGNGFFKFEKDALELELPEKADYQMNLSLFLPESRENLEKMLDDKTAYSFKKRGGWISTQPYNTIRKNRIYMFEEGSIFKSENAIPSIEGRMVNLKPEPSKLPENLKDIHDIWRNGEALFIPFNQ